MIFDGIINGIVYGVFSIFWYILVWFPYTILKITFSTFQYLGFPIVKKILFGSENQNENWKNVPTSYWAMGIIAIVLLIVVMIAVIFKFIAKHRHNNEESNVLIKALKKLLPSISLLVLIPFLTFAFIIILQIFLDLLFIAINGQKIGLAESLFISNKPDKIESQTWSEIATTKKPFSVISINTYSTFNWGEGVQTIIFLSISGILILYGMIKLLFVYAVKIVEIFWLFISSPIFSVWSIYDNGEKFKTWKNIYLGKFFMLLYYQVALGLLMIWIGVVNNLNNIFEIEANSKILSWLLHLALVWAGAITIHSLSAEIAQMFGSSISHNEASQMFDKSVKSGAMLLGGGAAAAGFASKKLIGEDFHKNQLKKQLKKGDISKLGYKNALRDLKNERKAEGLSWRDTRDGLLAGGKTNNKLYKTQNKIAKIDDQIDKKLNFMESDEYKNLKPEKQKIHNAKLDLLNNKKEYLKQENKPREEWANKISNLNPVKSQTKTSVQKRMTENLKKYDLTQSEISKAYKEFETSQNDYKDAKKENNKIKMQNFKQAIKNKFKKGE
ncbi:Mbov_0396 family ICE element transmembrane protein [Mesomycoplasma neurolyticum]|uniref:Uncharacterized protein n=2 Tax=Mesomycoplasma neurolyticum TaxID=2120 RepID=A0A449A5F9_9BACT|nr:hypothetical protein [Mesomycoplasma neurolyticum]VEU59476.1 Uncharacterised protein [Mesomycoplasma neurolyticum]